ncbi:MAG: KR domain-containing protein, partial [Bacteroidota bacterium]
STKTNFGHTFAASGLVSLISLVQALQHEMIPASLNLQEQSDYVNWRNTAFYVNQFNKPWKKEPHQPRMGAVSAFGMSGTNSHMVLAGYDWKVKQEDGLELPCYLLPLSAKTPEALQEQARNMMVALANGNNTMASIAYTLMTGRHHFQHRLAVVAANQQEALELLQKFLSGETDYAVLTGKIKRNFKEDKGIKKALIQLVEKVSEAPAAARESLTSIAVRYCEGYEIAWDGLFAMQIPQRVHLPTYPFSRKTYWVDAESQTDKVRLKHNEPSVETLRTVSTRPSVNTEVKSEEVREKEWLLTREKMVEAPLIANIDWNASLSRFVGKTICIVYSQESERDSLEALLRKLEVAGELSQSLTINTLAVDEINTAALKRITPAVVLFLGAQSPCNIALQPGVSDIAPLFELSKALMQAAWDEPVKLYYVYNSEASTPRLDCDALSGFFRSAMKENEAHVWRMIRLENQPPAARYQLLLKEWLLDDDDSNYQEIHHLGKQRFSEQLVETELPLPTAPVFKTGSNYLIIGGTGYIGGLLLEEISRKSQAKLFILSRSSFNEEIAQQFERLKSLGASPYHFQVDVTDFAKLKSAYELIKQQVGALHGVINLARAHDTKIIASKDWDSFHRVSLVKIQSAQYLDELTKDEPLDFFIMFAAMAAFGATGESDYAYSGAYQNAFVRYRNQLVKAGKRAGTSVAQCWGPWEEDKLFPGHVTKWKSFGCDLIDMKNAFPLIEATCIYPHGDIGINAIFDDKILRDWFGITGQPRIQTESVSYEAMISDWESEKKAGKSISLNDVQQLIPVAIMETLSDELVERIYSLCFGGEIKEDTPSEVVVVTKDE